MNLFYALCVSSAIMALDQISKLYVLHHNVSGAFGSFLNITLVRNSGFIFGLGYNLSQHVHIISFCVLIILLIYLIYSERDRRFVWSMFLGGGAGNLCDRLLYGHVIDFLDMHIAGVHYPWVFNVADVFITLGGVILIIDEVKRRYLTRYAEHIEDSSIKSSAVPSACAVENETEVI